MAPRKANTGAFLTGKLSPQEFKALCGHRPTTRNTHALISHKDVMKAAKEIGNETKEAFSAWLNGGSAAK